MASASRSMPLENLRSSSGNTFAGRSTVRACIDCDDNDQIGINDLHGGLLGFMRGTNRRPSSYNFTGNKTPYRQNQFGGSIEGPIRREQGILLCQLRREKSTRQSNIGYAGDIADHANVRRRSLFHESGRKGSRNRDALPGNIIPESRIAQFAKASQKYYQTPGGLPLPQFNYFGATGTRRRRAIGYGSR